ncbi:type IV pilus assembly protein PilM [Kamptonema cortianum]|nr:type IV pilus assembly protein PilM [Kamptonema cortianum]MDL5049727.1 type IV pilus assembly protein PilM [Oscillatoria amoena NRMC-F 0135]
MSSTSIVTIDIGSYTVKVAEFAQGKGGGLILRNFFFSDLEIDPSKEINPLPLVQDALAKIFKDNHIRHRKIAYSISGQSVFPKFIKLPPIDRPEKLKQIIKYEAQQNVPFPIEQVVWDYQIISPQSSAEYEVALFAVKSDLIEENYAMLTHIGLTPVMTDVAPMATYNAFRHAYGVIPGCGLIVDIGAKTTNLIFIEPDRFFCRSIPVGGNNLTQSIATEFQISFAEAEKLKRSKGFVGLGGAYEDPKDPDVARISKLIRQGMTRLHAEITRSTNFYRTQQGGKAPDRIYLAGGSSVMTYTPQFFKEKLNVEVEYFNPLLNIEVDPRIGEEAISSSVHSLSELVGLALRQIGRASVEINLEPPSIVSRRTARMRLPLYLGTAACVLIAIYLAWFSAHLKEQKIRSQVEELNTIVMGYEQNKSRISRALEKQSALEGEITKLTAVISQKDYFVKLARDLTARIHENMWITSFEPTTQTVARQAAPAAANPRDRRRREQQQPQENKEPAATVYLIEGLCKVDSDKEIGQQTSDIVYGFVERLAQSPFFVIPDVNRAIETLEAPKQGDFVYSFRIRVGVKPVEAFLNQQPDPLVESP